MKKQIKEILYEVINLDHITDQTIEDYYQNILNIIDKKIRNWIRQTLYQKENCLSDYKVKNWLLYELKQMIEREE